MPFSNSGKKERNRMKKKEKELCSEVNVHKHILVKAGLNKQA